MNQVEAKKRWCPFSRVAGDVVAYNRITPYAGAHRFVEEQFPTSSYCVGSACMAWRPGEAKNGSGGYCGLAGKP